MDPLKEMFNREFYRKLGAEFSMAYPKFNTEVFLADVTRDLSSLELNGRLRNTSVVLKNHLPEDFKKSVKILKEVVPKMNTGYTTLIFPDYIGLFGHDHFEISMDALEFFTQFGSSEFAIREFLKRDFKRTLPVMEKWSRSDNVHTRRLASEGSRPRLPWSFKLDEVIRNPKVTKTILENLKADDELYVKKSVANHLNDLSRESGEYMLQLVKTWDHEDPNTSWIVKRACRTLIKKGDGDALSVFSFEKNVRIEVENFRLSNTKIKLPGAFTFSFSVISMKSSKQKIVIDYRIHYRKKSNTSPKVFKLKEVELLPHQRIDIVKGQQFKDLTTRKHYPGIHQLEILINGKVFAAKKFTVSR